jgi:hypothetical protein
MSSIPAGSAHRRAAGPDRPHGRAAVLLEALAVTLTALGVYVALGQDVFWKGDAQQFVLAIQRGDTTMRAHVLYLPLLSAACGLLAPLELGGFRAAVVVSALGASVAAGILTIALAVLGIERRSRLLGALLVALTPGVVFFATVVEIHGMYLAFATLSFLLTAWLERGVTPVKVVLLALSMVLATGVHATGVLLPVVLLTFFLARRGRIARRDLVAALAVGVLHFGLVLGLGWWAGTGENLSIYVRTDRWHLIPSVLLFEWLLPLAPLSVLGLIGLAWRPARSDSVALALGAVPLLGVSWRLVAGDPELGAYLLPCLLPAAAIAARHLSPRLLGIACVLAGTGSWLALSVHERQRADCVTYAAGLRRACDADRAVLLVGHPLEVSATLVHAPKVAIFTLDLLARAPLAAIDTVLGTFDEMVRSHGDHGRPVYLTEAGRAYLSQDFGGLTPSGHAALAHIERHYDLEPHEAPGWRAWRLVKR